jgi:hypothetical protein
MDLGVIPEPLAMTKSMFSPLRYFYEELRLPLPHVRRAESCELPEPERSLLAHDRDMTPTLEAAYGGRLQLRVLRYAVSAGSVNRLVALVMEGRQEPVGMGAIHIFVTRLPSAAKERVLQLREPFGRILQETGVTHYSRPVAYFDVTADSVIMDALGMRESCILHGRRNTIWNASGEELADVVEILPPSKNIEHGRVS